MNCAECRDDLVAYLEGLLDAETSRQCRAHLENCAACRAELAALTALQRRLAERGRVASEASLVQPVMRRVHQAQALSERETIMSRLFRRWGFGLGAVAGAAVIVIGILLVSSPKAQATAAQVMANGAKAVAQLTSIHLRGQLRTAPADNFGYINADNDFVTIELWKQFEPELKWRVEKPGRFAVMDGESTLLYIKKAKLGYRFPMASPAAFDTGWLQRIANLSKTITNELENAIERKWGLSLTEERGADGRMKAVVTVKAKSGLPDNDYLKNSFLNTADTRRVYRFDEQSELLESVQIYLERPAGEVLIFDLNQIDYNQPIDSALWKPELPADVTWHHEPQVLPDNAKYQAMTAEQAARAFFEACGRKDWTEVAKFTPDLTPRLKKYLGGLQLVSLGKPFSSKAQNTNLQCFVPYEIRLHPTDIYIRLSNSNTAKRFVITGQYDSDMKPDEELKWTKEPPVLPNNEVYARMTPVEVVKAFFEASRNLDSEEVAKFIPESEAAKFKKQASDAKAAGMDLRNLIPDTEVGDAFWSKEHSAWLVKVRMSHVKKWNLALRRDNPAGRWQFDGGL